MKKLIVSAFLLIYLLSSCKTIEDLLTFDHTVSTDIQIPASPLAIIPVDISTPEINTSSVFEGRNVDADGVKNVKLTAMDMEIESPGEETFSFMNEIVIYISGENLPEILIASKTNISEDIGSLLQLETTGTNLDDYLKKGAYSIRIEAETDEIIPETVNINVNMTFEVTADLL